MNLNQLYYLQAIAQARGLTRAADALYVTQSNLSHSMAALEEELGIPLSELDYHQTGMIGESYTGITTTLGAIEAKRTTAWPEMGALCVRLLHEAGVRSGDTVGAGFSGSSPPWIWR